MVIAPQASGKEWREQYGAVPMELREQHQWVTYQRVPKADGSGKFDKVPFAFAGGATGKRR